MFCPNCGKAVPDGAIFCKECGARITHIVSDASTPSASQAQTPQLAAQEPALQTPQWAPSTQTPQQAPSAYAPQQTYAVPPSANNKSKRTRTILIVIIAAVVLLAGGIGGYLVFRNAQQQAAAQAAAEAAYNEAHTRHAVVFKVDAQGYADATASKIPVHVTGTDLDGATVDEGGYVDAEGEGLSLLRGTYTVTVVVSPLTSDGTVYDVPSTSWNVTVGDDVEPGATVDATAQPITLTVIGDITALTDDQIARIYDCAVGSGMDAATAGTYRDTLTSARQAAIDEKKAEEAAAAAAAAEAQKKAEEEAAAEAAAKKSACHFECEYFSLDVPESWAGKYYCDETAKGMPALTGWYNFYLNGKSAFTITLIGAGPDRVVGDAGVNGWRKDIGKTSMGNSTSMACDNTDYASYGTSYDELMSIMNSIELK